MDELIECTWPYNVHLFLDGKKRKEKQAFTEHISDMFLTGSISKWI